MIAFFLLCLVPAIVLFIGVPVVLAGLAMETTARRTGTVPAKRRAFMEPKSEDGLGFDAAPISA